ncbi:T9SS type A sorting domain-containing protein [Wenyingzhuangia aestuarii]|uniref:T9SS type A sorting domain-containing protein n=1 Tax=Wenyingzhuangia aestuarii TaxID=1647582 RepID=UPI00143AA1E0|nr:T9SS type A sorting domain-containing protein [Wenyingzhuangia aestuarii]NJB81544.1 hypothetical protein [Wenyingzhuangia aestuarii]
MKTKLLYLLFFIGIYTASADIRQTAYRWRNDDGNETTATWKANMNAPITIANDGNSIIRLRVQIYNYDNAKRNAGFNPKIIYSTDLNSTTKELDNTDSHFIYVDSPNLTDGEATTQQFGTESFQPAGVKEAPPAGSNITRGYSLSYATYTELEFVIKPTEDAINTTYYFRLNGLTDTAGSTLASLTLVDPTTLNNNTLEPGSFSYNNPINNTLNIESKNKITNVVVHNISGQKILEGNSTTLNTESLNSGIYFVTISTKNNKKAIFKIVKE